LQGKFNCKVIQLSLECDALKLEKRYDNRHQKEKRHKSHIASFPQVLEKYGGIEKLQKSSRINFGKIIKIDTNDFSGIKHEEICKEILDSL
jgi:hypothetical protein